MSRDIDELSNERPMAERAADDSSPTADTPLRTEFEVEQEEEEGVGFENENEKAYPLQPSTLWRRLRNVFIIIFLIGIATLLLRATSTKPKVIHAHRYSEEFRFRPAASPIITETLRDGRTRIRGAEPTQRSVPSQEKPDQRAKRGKKNRRGKNSKKGQKGRA